MAWQPPTENEFNSDWVTPDDGLGVLVQFLEERTRCKGIKDRLESGAMIAVARTGRSERDRSLQPFVPVSNRVWRHMDSSEEDHFWNSGDAVVQVPSSGNYGSGLEKHHYFDVRFDPQGFSGKPPTKAVADHLAETSDAPLPHPPPAPLKDLSVDDAERFSRAILAGWPDSTEEAAHKQATHYFPEHKVPRDWFKSIFRVIRGPKNPGKQPKNRF